MKNIFKGPKNVIRQPKYYLHVGIMDTIVFIGLGLFFLVAPESMIADFEEGIRIPAATVMFIIALPGLIIIMLQINWQITILDNEFIFRNILRISKRIHFNEIEYKEFKAATKFYRNGKYIVGLSYLQDNYGALKESIDSYKRNLRNL